MINCNRFNILLGHFIAGFVSVSARRGLLCRHGEAGNEAMLDKLVGIPVQLVWNEGKKSFWKTQAGPGSDK